jgi:hypothetical protein
LAQRKKAAKQAGGNPSKALAKLPRRESSSWTTTSTFSPRLQAIHGELDRRIRKLFPGAQASTDWNMLGWKVRRPRRVEWTHGTMDPNLLYVGIAERKSGITLHIWNPVEHDGLNRREAQLSAAGFKVMVGCLQFNRKGDYPVDAVVGILEGIKAQFDAER